MDYQIEITEDISGIESFERILNRYKDFKSCIRDIKINTLLGQKCLFEIEDITSLYMDISPSRDTSLNNSCAIVKKMSFKIDNNMKILSLIISYEILKTKMGKLILELKEQGIQINIKPKLLKPTDISQVLGFYIEIPD